MVFYAQGFFEKKNKLAWDCSDDPKYKLLKISGFVLWSNWVLATYFNFQHTFRSTVNFFLQVQSQSHSWGYIYRRNVCLQLQKKISLQSLILKVCESFLSTQSKKKTCSIGWSVWVLLTLQEKKRPNKYFLRQVNLVLYMYILILMYQNVNLFWKLVV